MELFVPTQRSRTGAPPCSCVSLPEASCPCLASFARGAKGGQAEPAANPYRWCPELLGDSWTWDEQIGHDSLEAKVIGGTRYPYRAYSARLYVRGYVHKLWPYMGLKYLHFRILKSPLRRSQDDFLGMTMVPGCNRNSYKLRSDPYDNLYEYGHLPR